MTSINHNLKSTLTQILIFPRPFFICPHLLLILSHLIWSLPVSWPLLLFSSLYFTYITSPGDIADTLLNDLLDLKAVFARIDSVKLSALLSPNLFEVIDSILKKEGETWFCLLLSFIFGLTVWKCIKNYRRTKVFIRVFIKLILDRESLILIT